MTPLNKIKANFAESWLFLWLTLFLLGSMPILTDWLDNRFQVTLSDLYLPLILNLIFSSIISLILYKGFKKNKIIALLGGISCILVNNISRTLQPVVNFIDQNGKGENYYSLIFIALFIGLTYFLIFLISKFSFTNKWNSDILAKGLAITIFVAFLLKFYPTAKTIIFEWPQFFYRPPQLTSAANLSSDKPDIYYIVLDRYTNQNVLKNQLNFDNSSFVNFLQENNFSVNPDAYSNYPYTTMSIASSLNANYNGDLVKKFNRSPLEIVEPFHDAIRYASVIEKMKSLDYSYYQLGSWYEASNRAPLADKNFQLEGQLTIFNHEFTLNNFPKNKLLQSVFWQPVRHGLKIGNFQILSYSSISESNATLYKLDQLGNIAQEAPGNRFIFAHILVPHDPYYFNADGSPLISSGTDNVGENIKEKYIGQVQFINKQMEQLISKIRENSNGKAVIILQSDEGPYPMEIKEKNLNTDSVGDELDSGDMTKWSDDDLKMKFGILAAYDIPAAKKEDLEAARNSVNIFRLVLNTYFGSNLAYLPECNYAYINGRVNSFSFTDITTRLTSQANNVCPVDSNFN